MEQYEIDKYGALIRAHALPADFRPKPVYLGGAINGRTDDECVVWRETAAKLLDPIPVLNPIQQRDSRGRELDPGLPEFIVHGDEKDLASSCCNLVLFDGPSVGTAMEIRIAFKELRIPVYVIDISGKVRSPWLVYHTTQFFETLADACAFIKHERVIAHSYD